MTSEVRSGLHERAWERRLEQGLAELAGERPAPLAEVLVRRDAAALARAAARLDGALRPRVALAPLLAAAMATVALVGVWWSARSGGRAGVAAQQPVQAPEVGDVASLVALAPRLRGVIVTAANGPDGRRLAPGPERDLAVAEPSAVAALRMALARATAVAVPAGAMTGRVTLCFDTTMVDAAFLVAGDDLTLRLPAFAVVMPLGGAATSWTAALRASVAANVPVRRRIPVTNVQELARALGSDRTLEIDAAEPLILDDAFSDGVVPDASALRFERGDGLERSPTLRGLRNLHLRAVRGTATLLVRSAQADVLRLLDCEGVVLEGLVLGHQSADEPCQAPVLTVRGGKDLRLLRCELFGCGAMGLDAADTGAVHLVATRIHTCSIAVLEMRHSGPLRCDLGTFERCGLWQAALTLSHTSATFVGCRLTGMTQQTPVDLFACTDGRIVWRGGVIGDNLVRGLGGGDSLALDGVDVGRNHR